MVSQAGKLAKLEEVARLKADLELRRFAAFRQHVAFLDKQIKDLSKIMVHNGEKSDPASLADLRSMAALASTTSQKLIRCENERTQLTPKFEDVRRDAVRAFGRAEVLRDMRQKLRAKGAKASR